MSNAKACSWCSENVELALTGRGHPSCIVNLANAERDSLKAQLEAARAELVDVYASETDESRHLRAQLDALRAERDLCAANLEKERAGRRDEVKAYNAACTQLGTERDEARAQADAYFAELATAYQDLRAAHAEVEKLEQSRQDIAQLHSDASVSNTALRAIVGELCDALCDAAEYCPPDRNAEEEDVDPFAELIARARALCGGTP